MIITLNNQTLSGLSVYLPSLDADDLHTALGVQVDGLHCCGDNVLLLLCNGAIELSLRDHAGGKCVCSELTIDTDALLNDQYDRSLKLQATQSLSLGIKVLSEVFGKECVLAAFSGAHTIEQQLQECNAQQEHLEEPTSDELRYVYPEEDGDHESDADQMAARESLGLHHFWQTSNEDDNSNSSSSYDNVA